MVHLPADLEEKFFLRAGGQRGSELFFDDGQPPFQVLKIERAWRIHERRQLRKPHARFFHTRSDLRLRRAYGRGGRQKPLDISREEGQQCIPRKSFFRFFLGCRDRARACGGFFFFFRGVEHRIDAVGKAF
jgi:hypothetical protein